MLRLTPVLSLNLALAISNLLWAQSKNTLQHTGASLNSSNERFWRMFGIKELFQHLWLKSRKNI